MQLSVQKFCIQFVLKYIPLRQGSEPVQGTKTKTGKERNFDWNRTRTRNEIKFYSSEQNQKFEMAINVILSFHLIFEICCQPITNSSSRLRPILQMWRCCIQRVQCLPAPPALSCELLSRNGNAPPFIRG